MFIMHIILEAQQLSKTLPGSTEASNSAMSAVSWANKFLEGFVIFFVSTAMEYCWDSSEGDAIVFNIVPNVLNVAKIFGVPFKTFADIEDLLNGIENGKHEAVWSRMTEEMRKDVIDSMFTTWKRLMDENPSVASNVGNKAMDTFNDDTLHVDDPPIVQSVSIQDMVLRHYGTRQGVGGGGRWGGEDIRGPGGGGVEGGEEGGSKLGWVAWRRRGVGRGWVVGDGDQGRGWGVGLGTGGIGGGRGEWGSSLLCLIPIPPRCAFEFLREKEGEVERSSGERLESEKVSFARRYLIEINVNDVLKESLTMGVLLIDDSGFTIETVSIEYEWKPPRCDLCKIFGHVLDHCPKKVSVPPTIVTSTVVTPTVE
ncbi:hypothetical protein Tco_0598536 [Tanacetum coccineum]